jgi:hypothetical protein
MTMKRIPRNPAKYDVFELFHSIAEQQGFSPCAPGADQRFLEAVRQSLNRHKTDRLLLYGKRTEFMFGFVAAALGKASMIRHEDNGELFVADPDVQPPDYRIVLKAGPEFFVEVKNYHQMDALGPFTVPGAYVSKLEKYAAIFNKDVKFAVYWVRWNMWTLCGLERFERDGDRLSIDMFHAIKYNEMAALGDYMLATRPPLALVILPDTRKPRFVDRSGLCKYTVGSIEMYCGAEKIDDKFEKDLAFFLMLYGRWGGGEQQMRVVNRLLSSISLVVTPEERTPDQEFEIVDNMSGLMSARYRAATSLDEPGSIMIRPAKGPEFLEFQIPDDYKGKQLPLWRFIIHPTEDTDSSGGRWETSKNTPTLRGTIY